MNAQTFREQVARQFGYLLDEHGFVIIHDAYDHEHFGNALVVLESDICRWRVSLDRGEVWVEIGPLAAPAIWSVYAPALWFSVRTVIEWLTEGAVKVHGGSAERGPTYDEIIEARLWTVAEQVKPYVGRICPLFASDAFNATQRELVAFQERRMQAWLERAQHRKASASETGQVKGDRE